MSSTYAGTNTFPTSITIPSDGDIVNASAFNAAYEGLADRTIWLFDRVNGTGYVTLNAGLTGGSLGSHTWANAGYAPSENLGLLSLAGLKANDIIELEWWASAQFSGAPNNGALRVAVSENATSYTDAGATWTDAVGGFSETLVENAATATELYPTTLHCAYPVVASAPAAVRVVVQGKVAAPNVFVPQYGFKARILRSVP